MQNPFATRSLAAALLASAAIFTPFSAAAEEVEAEAKDEKWDVSAPKGAEIRQVPIRTDEGTWMDVDVSFWSFTLCYEWFNIGSGQCLF